jgi:hypothetical protein
MMVRINNRQRLKALSVGTDIGFSHLTILLVDISAWLQRNR